jgi:protein-tyrosine-phosphatase/DNA-binding transcriptional ArsR family regulator
MSSTATMPPEGLKLVAHPQRWRVLSELARSDLRVGELSARLGEPQNLVSYHLRELRRGGLVSSRRSSADGRDSYYRVDLGAVAGLLAAAGTALHPGARLVPEDPGPRGLDEPLDASVLFLCTGNSARSQMAEGFLVHHSGGTVEAASAGSHPKPLHPAAVRVMAERGIDISGHRSTHLDECLGRRFTDVITLCDRVREVCPELPGHPLTAHWSVPDPAATDGTADDVAFQKAADEIEERVLLLLAALRHRAGRVEGPTNPEGGSRR